MRKRITATSVKLWLSPNDTYYWAHGPKIWPCSRLSNKRVFVEYDSNGLCDLSIDGKSGYNYHTDINELNAMVADFLKNVLSADHKLHNIIIGQFV